MDHSRGGGGLFTARGPEAFNRGGGGGRRARAQLTAHRRVHIKVLLSDCSRVGEGDRRAGGGDGNRDPDRHRGGERGPDPPGGGGRDPDPPGGWDRSPTPH